MVESEWLFYGGIGMMAAAAVMALISVLVFSVTGKKLKQKLEQEYGKPLL